MNQSVWGPVQREMTDLLQGHPDDVPAVVDQLKELQAILGHVPPLLVENPLCDFNQLYLTITEGVLERLYAGHCIGLEGVEIEIFHVVEDQGRPKVLLLPAGLNVADRQVLHMAAI